MNITISKLSGVKQVYEVDASTIVADLKEAIYKREAININRIQLIFAGRRLDDHDTLESVHIEEGSTLLMTLKMPTANPGSEAQKISVAKKPSCFEEVSDEEEDKEGEEFEYRVRLEQKLKQNQENTARFGELEEQEQEQEQKSTLQKPSSLVSATLRSIHFESSCHSLFIDSDSESGNYQSHVSEILIRHREEQESRRAVSVPSLTSASKWNEVKSAVHAVRFVSKSALPEKYASKPRNLGDDVQKHEYYVDETALVSETHGKKSLGIQICKFVLGSAMIGLIIAVFSFYIFPRTPTNAPTLSPTVVIDTSIPINTNLLQKLLLLNVSSEQDLLSEDTPQRKSLMQLADEDENKTNIFGQYVLFTIMNGLSGNKWNPDDSNFNSTECSWDWIECEDNVTITGLNLHNQGLQGEIVDEIGYLTDLKNIDLGQNSIKGTLPSSFGEMKSLEKLQLQSNLFTGSVPSNYNNLTSLEILDLSSNSITGSLPDDIWEFEKLRNLMLFGTSISGTIPNTISHMHSLEVLNLSQVKISGTIPTEFGLLFNLKRLFMENEVTGTIPTEFGNLVNLEELYFGFTLMTGSLPTEMGNMKNLAEVTVQGNQLSKRIPSELGKLNNITTFFVETELFSGSIPSEIGNWGKVTNLYLCNTDLKGMIPSKLCDLSSSSVKLTVDKDIDCKCCHKCKNW